VTLAAAARSAAKRFDDGTVAESEFLDEAAASARRLLALGLIRLPAR